MGKVIRRPAIMVLKYFRSGSLLRRWVPVKPKQKASNNG